MKITYAFYKASAPGASWKDKIIAWWTKGPYSHMEIIVGTKMYSSSPRAGDVRAKDHTYDPKAWDYVTIDVDPAAIEKFKKFFEMTKGRKYDWLGIAGFVIPIHDSESRYFCSEWCTKASIIMGVSCFYDYNPPRVSPVLAANILKRNHYELDPTH